MLSPSFPLPRRARQSCTHCDQDFVKGVGSVFVICKEKKKTQAGWEEKCGDVKEKKEVKREFN